MNILVACEFSGIVRDAFKARGHDAISIDLLPTEREGNHIIADVHEIENWERFDLLIAHPPCTFLTNAGNCWFGHPKYPHREQDREEAIRFFNWLWTRPVAKICVENPIPTHHLTDVVGSYTQTIQPYQFGEDASKRTCLWLKGLPKLEPTQYVEPKIVNGQKRWANQSPSGASNIGPSPDRWKKRSRTFEGIALAMAEQWG